MDLKTETALIPRPPLALEGPAPGAQRILSGMVADTLALAAKPKMHITPDSSALTTTRYPCLDGQRPHDSLTPEQRDDLVQAIIATLKRLRDQKLSCPPPPAPPRHAHPGYQDDALPQEQGGASSTAKSESEAPATTANPSPVGLPTVEDE